MQRYYDDNVVIQFRDLRTLIQEEFQKFKEEDNKKVVAPKPLSIQQVAERYDKSKATVHNWMKQGIITGFKMGKGRFFHLDELEENLTRFNYLEILESKGLIEKQKKLIY
jgi:transposase